MNSNEDVQADVEAINDLKKMGYAQDLIRDMGGFSSFAISFSVISILTGISQLYGYGLVHGGPFQLSFGWMFVCLFSTTVALPMAELASAYPTSGALYHWSTFLGCRSWGWFTACFNAVGQFAIVAGIDYGLASFLPGIFGWESTPKLVGILYIGILLSHSILNHIGIKVVTALNNFSAWYHIIVVALLLGALAIKGFVQPISFLTTFKNGDINFGDKYSFLIGLLMAQWTLTGYDAAANVSEETHNPRMNAPWGIMIAVVVSAIAGFFMIGAITLSIGDLDQAMTSSNAFIDVFKARLGVGLGGGIVFLIAGAMWMCGLAAMTSASRMLYAFARDGGLPFSGYWNKISNKYKTPANAIWGLAICAALITVSVDVYSAVVSVAVISLYLSYGMPTMALLYRRFHNKRKKNGEVIGKGPWNIGKFSTPVAVLGVSWMLFITVLFVLPPNEKAGYVMSGIFLFFLIVWFAVANRKFQGPKIDIDSF